MVTRMTDGGRNAGKGIGIQEQRHRCAFPQHNGILYRQIDPHLQLLRVRQFHDALADHDRFSDPIGLVRIEQQPGLLRLHLDLRQSLMGIVPLGFSQLDFGFQQWHIGFLLGFPE